MAKAFIMAMDQLGNTVHDLKHPRKELMEWCGKKNAHKMYVEKKDGSVYHVGYVIGQHWFTLYDVSIREKEDK